MSSLIKLHRSVLSIIGDDSEKFLQGQVSCNLAELKSDQMSFGTINTPKGRMYGFFRIIRFQQGFLLSIETSTAELILKQLSKYIAFFKCEMSELEDVLVYGDILDISTEQLTAKNYPKEAFSIVQTDETVCIQLPSSSNHQLVEIWDLKSSLTTISFEKSQSEHWSSYETLQGIPELYQSTQDVFILQYLNLHKLGAVSFNKGCYTGQEIIARMKFLGKQKKMTYLLTSDTELCVDPNSALFDAQGKKCGTVIRSHYSPQTGSVALALINNSYVEANNLAYLDQTNKIEFTISEISYNPR